ncbi:MAG: putative molybdenum carrier protein [Bacteroidales bacterium]|jgi:hypothetical protein|nr:putative molybdenum carrier protein [Bacteroidales bacterium]
MRIKIISGGQTGVDRAALDIAKDLNIKTDGYCPKGRLAEDGIIDQKYQLTETKTSFYQERTRKNIDISDGVLILCTDNKLIGGTGLCLKYAKKKNKKILIIDLNNHIYNNINDFLKWVKTYNLKNINIAGNRESNNQGIYQKTYEFLKECLNLIH